MRIPIPAGRRRPIAWILLVSRPRVLARPGTGQARARPTPSPLVVARVSPTPLAHQRPTMSAATLCPAAVRGSAVGNAPRASTRGIATPVALGCHRQRDTAVATRVVARRAATRATPRGSSLAVRAAHYEAAQVISDLAAGVGLPCTVRPPALLTTSPRTPDPPSARFLFPTPPPTAPARSRPRLTPNPTPTPPPDPKLRRSDLPIHPGRQPSRRDPSAVHPHRPLPPHPPRPLPHRHSRRPRRLRRLLHPPPPPRPAFLLHRRFHPRP